MSINENDIFQTIDLLASIDGTIMDVNALAEDVYLLSEVFGDESDFKSAIHETVRALFQITNSEITPAKLKYSFENFNSYHFQHNRAQGNKADMRVVYKKTNLGIYVVGFGHRRLPTDVYERLAKDRLRAK